MVDWAVQRRFEDVQKGDAIPSLSFPLTVHRLVVHAGASRDYSPIHHNRDVAVDQGAPDMYANNVFLQSMWERAIREWIGLDGVIKRLGPFRMTRFTPVGETVVVSGVVARTWTDAEEHLVELSMRSTISLGDCVVGSVVVSLPSNQKEFRS